MPLRFARSTVVERSGLTCGDAESPRPFRSRPTRRTTGCGAAATAGRPPAFDPQSYKQRNVVERAINKLKGHRAVATHYDCDYMFRGTVDVASIRIWLRDPSHDPGGTLYRQGPGQRFRRHWCSRRSTS